MTTKPPKSKKHTFAFILLLIAALGSGMWWMNRNKVETDDAFIAGRVVTIAPKVGGFITALHVNDNQNVKAGDVLAEIDPRDYQIKLDGLTASLEGAQADLDQAKADMERLLAQSSLSASVQARQQSTTKVHTAQAKVDGLKAEIAKATTDLEHTRVIAPMDGTIAKRGIEVGSFVESGQALMAVVGTERWIVANFKETQLDKLRVDQAVEIEVDAYPELKLHGRIESLQNGTGSSFSAFPAENATGNFVKVVQRVPVKILLTDAPPADRPLAVGMSVVPVVTTTATDK